MSHKSMCLQKCVCVSSFDLFQFKCLAVCNKEDKAAVSFLHMQSKPNLVSSFNEGSRNTTSFENAINLKACMCRYTSLLTEKITV